MANRSKHKSTKRAGQKAFNSGAGQKPTTGQIRIVAGHWRGRKIPVLDSNGLRPTGDRVRETLFNWLQFDIPGRRCLDLFAGSGALGLEAASRGAGSVTLVESSAPVAAQLKQTLDVLNAPATVSLYTGTAQTFLNSKPLAYDVVFVDPPFEHALHASVLNQLVGGCLNPDALVYVECPSQERDRLTDWPGALEIIKEKVFGDVTAILLRLGRH